MFGLMGKLLHIDLSSGSISEEALDPGLASDYIGGTGLGTRLLWDQLEPTTDPLGPDNVLAFMTGPLEGTTFPTSVRYEVCTKSPLTGGWLDASSGGEWAHYFKRTGYDGVIITGRAPQPVYLWITEGHAEIRDAGQLWGLDSFETQERIRDDLGEKRARVLCIGPAGEKQVLISAVMNDEGRAAGRGGAGAVMGSKNLKAIATFGRLPVAVAADEMFKATVKQINAGLAASPIHAGMTRYGTAGALDTGWASGDVPVRNWHDGIWKEGSQAIGGKRLAETYLVQHPACMSCTIRCARWVEVPAGRYALNGPGPEYETLAMLGTNLMNDNLEALLWINDRANRLGLDTISLGSAIGWAMEAWEKGYLTHADTGGLDLSWGNVDSIVTLVEQVGSASGLGKLLGQGVRRAAAEVGGETADFACHVKGMEVPAHDPRAFFSLAVSYATSPRGACHLHGMPMMYEQGLVMPEAGITYKQGRFDPRGKGLAAKVAQDWAEVVDSMVICTFASMALQPMHAAGVLQMVTGIPYTAAGILAAGERAVNLQRLFNLRAGWRRADDRLPKRLLEPTADGGHAGRVPDLESQLEEYYALRGWDREGVPTPATLERLGLAFAEGAALASA